MSETRKHYSDEFKKECVDYYFSQDDTLAKVATDLGINKKTLSNWVVAEKKRRAGEPAKAPKAPQVDPELRAAQKRIRELEMENEFLKKASAFFAANQL